MTDTPALVERLKYAALEKRGIQLNEAHAAFHRADARAEALETALRACRTFVISCRAEAKGRNQNRFALADELLGKIDDTLPLAASPTQGAEQ